MIISFQLCFHFYPVFLTRLWLPLTPQLSHHHCSHFVTLEEFSPLNLLSIFSFWEWEERAEEENDGEEEEKIGTDKQGGRKERRTTREPYGKCPNTPSAAALCRAPSPRLTLGSTPFPHTVTTIHKSSLISTAFHSTQPNSDVRFSPTLTLTDPSEPRQYAELVTDVWPRATA